MLPAKLFVALALLFTVCALLNAGGGLSLDLYLHATYFVFGPRLLFIYGAVTSANFAVLYYATTRCWNVRWNRALGVWHFSLVVLAAILFFIVAGSAPALNDGSANRAIARIFIPGFLGFFSFLLSWGIFAANLVWTAVRTVRVRHASH
jgi:heme/copper-type cytochrome/quinol oxidase subunit 1